ncbi:hypothetical protein SLEP1_g44312 [Rubroshorea leprosula]|uniref:Uncharacterized protein n=1 Tax=Rubroshorea leprosula TaxID=152421 RepID=A0AAV5LFX0_9ROSI|nr:hypothetical protein SLEP1_g44312 [Rubroshorea leprosula]
MPFSRDDRDLPLPLPDYPRHRRSLLPVTFSVSLSFPLGFTLHPAVTGEFLLMDWDENLPVKSMARTTGLESPPPPPPNKRRRLRSNRSEDRFNFLFEQSVRFAEQLLRSNSEDEEALWLKKMKILQSMR